MLSTEKTPLPPTIIAAPLIRAQAFLGLNKELQAEQSLDAFKKRAETETPNAQLVAKHAHLRMQLKLRQCEQLPEKRPIEEAFVRAQMQRRGTCILEALAFFKKIYDRKALSAAELSSIHLKTAFQNYRKACNHPPPPPPGRNPLETQRYLQELAQILRFDCNQRAEQATTILNSWVVDQAPELSLIHI